MLNTQVILTARANIRSLFDQFNVLYGVTPFDEALYQQCIDNAIQHGYPVDGDHSVRTYLQEGVIYAATAGAHLPHRATQIWIALYTSCAIYVNNAADNFPEELPSIYLFNSRFITGERQESSILDTFADVIRRASNLYHPVASQLIVSSTLNFIIANSVERETKSMKISNDAQQYPTYQRTMAGVAEPYAFMAFPREVPLNDYIQAIPEMIPFIHNVKDVLSFYREQVDETSSQIPTPDVHTERSRPEKFDELTETTINVYKRIVKILEGSPEACEAFKKYTGGYLRFHTSLERYKLEDLDL